MIITCEIRRLLFSLNRVRIENLTTIVMRKKERKKHRMKRKKEKSTERKKERKKEA